MAVLLMTGAGPLLAGSGCVEPQSTGSTRWCKAADPALIEVIDDMEDGDGAACNNAGNWWVKGAGDLRPGAGKLGRAADLEGDDLMARRPSVRAMHAAGTLDAGGTASLFLALNRKDLSPYMEIQCWARSDGEALTLRVNVTTAATTDSAEGGTCDPGQGGCGDHFGDGAFQVTGVWGSSGLPNSVALTGITQDGAGQKVPRDFSKTMGIEFRVEAPADAPKEFGFWIDDVQVKR
jgi:hypothetical protein